MAAPPDSEERDVGGGLAGAGSRFDSSRTLLFCLLLLALLTLFFHGSLIDGRLLSPADLLQHSALIGASPPREPSHRLLSDAVYQFEPWRRLNWESLTAGRLLHLDPTTYCGSPFLARFQAAPFHPLRLVPVGTAPRIHGFFHLLELFLAGAGFYLLLAFLGFSEPARWLGGLAWSFSGFLVVWRLWPHSAAAGTLSWILLGLVLFQSGRRLGGLAATVGAVTLSWLGGHPQTTVLILLVAAAYAVFRSRGASQNHGRGAWAWVAATLVSTGLVAFFLLPGVSYLADSHAWSVRAPLFGELRSAPPSSPISIAGFFLPYLFGSRLAGYLPLDVWLGAPNTSELAGGYVSIVLVAALLPLALIGRRRGPEFRFWFGLLLVSLALAAKLPLVAWLFHYLPLIGAIGPERWVLFAGLAELMIAVEVLESLRQRPLTARGNKAVLGFLLLAGAACLATAGGARAARPWVQTQVEERVPVWSDRLEANPALRDDTSADLRVRLEKTTVNYPLWIGILMLLAAGAMHLARSRPTWLPCPHAPLISLIVLDLFVFGYEYTPSISAEAHFPSSQTTEYLQSRVGPFRVAAAGRALPPNVFSYYGLSDIRGYDAMEPAVYMQVALRVFGMSRAMPPNFKFYDHPDYTHPFADFLGLKFLVTEQPLEALVGRSRRSERFRLVFHPHDGVYVYQNEDALPGYYLATKVIPVPDAEQRLRRIEGWVSAERIAVVERGPERSFNSRSRIRMTNSDDGTLVFEGEFPEEGFLVVAQNYQSGWSCWVDGEAVPVMRTNHAFLGVPVKAGARRIEFAYRSDGLRAGLLVSFSALLVLVAWGILELSTPSKVLPRPDRVE